MSGAALDTMSRPIPLNSPALVVVTLRDLTFAQADGQVQRGLHEPAWKHFGRLRLLCAAYLICSRFHMYKKQ